MSYDESIRSITLEADATVALYTGVPGLPGSASPNGGKQYHWVKLSGAHKVGLATTGDGPQDVVGVVQNKPQVTGAATTVAIRGVSRCLVGNGGVAAGDFVKIDGNGQTVKATLPGDAADVVGQAFETASAGTIVPVLLKI